MEITSITPSDSKLWEQVWRLYNDSFPEHERRRISSHALACEDDAFHTGIALENGNLAALFFYWEYDDKFYIEHLAVNPAMRGRNIGSSIIRQFIEKEAAGHTVVLEIDPPEDEISIRRLGFYKRLGFRETGFDYTHPSYSKKGQPHTLVMMSYPNALTEEEFERFKDVMLNKIAMYRD